jgi:hypothetical protein
MSIQMPGVYGTFIFLPKPVVGYSRGNPPKQQILPPTIGRQYRGLVFRPRFMIRSRGNPVNPPVPTLAQSVFAQLQLQELKRLDLTIQPPFYSILPPPPTVPPMPEFFFRMHPAILYQLLIRRLITPEVLIPVRVYPLFGLEQKAEHKQQSKFAGTRARFG